MVLQVHDELVFEIYREDVEPFAKALVPIMRDAMKLAVPLDVELRCGDNWEELKHLAIELPAPCRGGPCLSCPRSRRSGATWKRHWSGASSRTSRSGWPSRLSQIAGLTPADLIGKRIEGLRRRAKFLIFDLSDGLALVFHLRLAGQLVHRDAAGQTLAEGGHPVPAFGAPLPHRSTHVIFRFDDGSVLYLTDIRQFGRVWILPEDGVQPLLDLAKLGPEPLDPAFTEAVLRERLARRQRCPSSRCCSISTSSAGSATSTPTRSSSRASLTPATRIGDLDDAAITRLHACDPGDPRSWLSAMASPRS